MRTYQTKELEVSEKSRTVAQVEITRNTNLLLDHYVSRFTELFGEKPKAFDEEDQSTAAWAVQHYSMTKAKSLLDLYLVFKNDWIKEQGYPLRLFKKNINAIIVGNAHVTKSFKPVWVVGYCADGTPVCNNDPGSLKETGFKPILWEEWVKLDVAKPFVIQESP
jgi:hypothetical protein